jgi:hypothetical protein
MPSHPSRALNGFWNMSGATHTHRVAIANNRIVDIEDGKVRFRWKDYRDENRQKVMTLDAGEFIRRFLVHVLPEGFQRIRYYGFMGNRCRKQKLARCRELLGMQQSDMPVKPKQGKGAIIATRSRS